MLLTFYYPWFPAHWSENGIYPFTNYHPTLGYYDSYDDAVIARHVAAMQYGNIEGAIVSWWGQGSYEDARFDKILTRTAGSTFRWAVYYEPEGYRDPSPSQITSDLTYLRSRYGSDTSYLRINGRFVVFVYADAKDGCEMADRWREANTGGAYVVLKVFPGYRSCGSQPAAWHQYGPSTGADSQTPYSYSVSPGFWKVGEQPRLSRDLVRWRQNIQEMIASGASFQLITTFNEWAEGTSIESASEWSTSSGYGAYLDSLHQIGFPKSPISVARAPHQTLTVITASENRSLRIETTEMHHYIPV